MGMDLVFIRKSGNGMSVPSIPRWVGHHAFLKALEPVEVDTIPDGEECAWRPKDIEEAARIVSEFSGCQSGHLRILWQMRHDPDLFLAVSY